MCYGLNKYCNNISIKSSYFFCILKQNPFILALCASLSIKESFASPYLHSESIAHSLNII